MRPENIGNISNSIISSMKRSLLHNQQEQSQSRTGRKGGSPTHDQVYDILNYISDATSVTSKYFDGYDKELEDLTQDELKRLASELISKFPDEYKEYSEETIGSYKGSRKGSVDWDKFIGWEDASNYQDRERFMSVFRDVTGHDYLSDYGEEFDDEEKAQRILDTLEGHLGSRNGSRKGATLVNGKSPMEYLKMLYDLQGFPSQQDVISHGSETDAEEYLRNNAAFYGIEYEKFLRDIVEEYEE